MEILEIKSFEEYSDFILELANNPSYYDPHFAYDKDNLYGALKRKDEYSFAVIENGAIKGIFVWLIITDENYIEMLIGFTKSKEAFREMFSYMESKYRGYKVDFVINPKNFALCQPLKEKGAVFDTEQQKMVHTAVVSNVDTSSIELYTEKWKEQYCELHSTETYWTAERVLSAKDRFRVLLVIKDGQVQGYLDVTYSFEKNEPYDIFVRPEYRYQGYELALLAKAIELNRPHQMMVLVDVDALEDIAIYTAAGFKKVEGQNSIYATYRL